MICCRRPSFSLFQRFVGHTVTEVCCMCPQDRAMHLLGCDQGGSGYPEAMHHLQPANSIQPATTSSRDQDEEAEVLLPTSHESSSPTRRQAAGQPSSASHATQRADHTATTGWQGGHRWHSSQPGSCSGTSGDTRAKLCLCGAHALARWGWRTWEFAVVRQECNVHAAGTASRVCAQRPDRRFLAGDSTHRLSSSSSCSQRLYAWCQSSGCWTTL